jgi:transposase
MPRAIAVATRETIVARHLAGATLPQIAADLDLPWATVRRIWRRYRDRGEAGLAPNYAACGRRGPRHQAALYAQALAVRREHPDWGSGLIRVALATAFPDQPLPDERTIRRWLAAAGLAPAPPPPRPPSPPRATQPHERWQVDATEQIRLADGRRVSWLAASDEATGAMLGTVVFPPRAVDDRAADGGADGTARLLRAVGAAADRARRQRAAVGLVG